MKLLPAQWYGRRIGETGGTALKTLWLDFEFCHFVNKFNSLLSSLLSEQTTPLKNAAFLCCWFILFIRNKDTNVERVLALVVLGHTKLYNNMFVKQPPQRDLQMAAGQTCFRTFVSGSILSFKLLSSDIRACHCVCLLLVLLFHGWSLCWFLGLQGWRCHLRTSQQLITITHCSLIT